MSSVDQILDQNNYKGGYSAFQSLFAEAALQVAMDKAVDIYVERAILEDCFASALNSVEFHKHSDSKYNYFKEAAHIAFWIVRLKPARVDRRDFVEAVVNRTTRTFWHVTRGPSFLAGGKLKPETRERLRQRLQPKDDPQHTMNEMIALQILLLTAKAGQKHALESCPGHDDKDHLSRRFTIQQDWWRQIEDDLIQSFRYYSFSARSFSMLVESIFSAGKNFHAL